MPSCGVWRAGRGRARGRSLVGVIAMWCALAFLPGTVAEASLLGLHVSGNRLLNPSGSPVHLHGVNRAGTEYAWIQGWGIFDGPSDDASIGAIRSWHGNVVHPGLNEDCVLGSTGCRRPTPPTT